MSEQPYTHPLYRAAEAIMAHGDPSVRHLVRLMDLFTRHELPMPIDLSTALITKGYSIP